MNSLRITARHMFSVVFYCLIHLIYMQADTRSRGQGLDSEDGILEHVDMLTSQKGNLKSSHCKPSFGLKIK